MKRSKVSRILVFIFVLFMFLLMYMVDGFDAVERQVYDSLYERPDLVDQDIIIVGIDDEAYVNIGRWPYSRRIQSQIFQNILNDEPRVLAVDILYDSSDNSEEDQMLVETLGRDNVVLAKAFSDSYMATEIEGYMIEPFEELNALVETGFINPEPDSTDGIVRRTKPVKSFKGERIKSFALAIYENLSYDGSKYETDSQYFIDYVSEPSTSGKTSKNKYDEISADDVLRDELPDGFFEDAIVLFGPFTLGMQDEYITPVNKTSKMYGIEIHANLLQNLMEDRFKTAVSIWYDMLAILLAAVLSYIFIRKFNLRLAIVLNILLAGLMFGVGFILYSSGYVAEMTYAVFVVIALTVLGMFYEYMDQLFEKRRITGIFGRYVASQVVDQILEAGESSLQLGGTKRRISVLFVDIRGFTPLSEVAEPEMVVEILNDYLDLCSNAIFNNDGTLDKFIGDATMALFNAPLDLDDHEFKVVNAAWEMKVKGEALAEKLYDKYGKNVRFGIGVNTGEAIIGNIGSKVRMDYTAIGDTVNTAARLESNAKPGQILISDATYQKVKDRVQVTALGGLSVKGKSNKITVYQVDGIIEE